MDDLPPIDEIAAFFLETYQGWGACFYPQKYIDKLYQISRDNNETCDYCEKPVALDCRGCGQKLCRECIDKYPCKPGGGKAGDEERTRQKGGGW